MKPHPLLMSALAFLLAGAASGADPAQSATAKSLYSRLGGNTKVTAIVNAAVERLATNAAFAKTDTHELKAQYINRICALAGGECETPANPSGSADPLLGMSDADFFKFVEALRAAMRAERVPLVTRNELLEILAPAPRDLARR